ncbi:cytochrome P450 [Nocardia colli]|uniref:cytochrome P450 n=1 Tax=Nocardia colli TaxID=2545717 RepID=UPI0035E1E90F
MTGSAATGYLDEHIDLADPGFYVDDRPERLWRSLREAPGPVRAGGARDYWVMTKYRDVETVLRDTVSFTSESGMHLGSNPEEALRAARAVAGKMLIVSDGEAHRAIRRAIGGAFTPRRVARLEQSTLHIARGLVRSAASGEAVDFVEEVAVRLPVITLCDLLGVPEQERDYVLALTRTAFGDTKHDPLTSQAAANAELFGYCDDLIERKRARPADDVATVLACAMIDGRAIAQDVAVFNAHGIISGGNETTRHASCTAAMSMYLAPEQWQALRNRETTLEYAVDEILRVSSPANHMMRLCTTDTDVATAKVRAGEFVTLWLGSANRDADAFPDPDRTDFARRPNRHLAFGAGAHSCLGAYLARLELRCLIIALLEHVSEAMPTGDPTRLASSVVRGYTSVPLRLDPYVERRVALR